MFENPFKPVVPVSCQTGTYGQIPVKNQKEPDDSIQFFTSVPIKNWQKLRAKLLGQQKLCLKLPMPVALVRAGFGTGNCSD